MRQFIAALLMFMLPLQAAFAAGAAYCNLEPPKASAHFGHHEHSAQPAADSDGSKKIDGECEICHLGCIQAQVSSVHPMPLFEQPTTSAALNDPEPDHFQEASHRPPRVQLA